MLTCSHRLRSCCPGSSEPSPGTTAVPTEFPLQRYRLYRTSYQYTDVAFARCDDLRQRIRGKIGAVATANTLAINIIVEFLLKCPAHSRTNSEALENVSGEFWYVLPVRTKVPGSAEPRAKMKVTLLQPPELPESPSPPPPPPPRLPRPSSCRRPSGEADAEASRVEIKAVLIVL